MLLSIDAFQNLIQQYRFNITSLSNTWLTENIHLLEFVQLPNYNMTYNNSLNKRGGRVGMYIKQYLKCKVRKDIIELDDHWKHL